MKKKTKKELRNQSSSQWKYVRIVVGLASARANHHLKRIGDGEKK